MIYNSDLLYLNAFEQAVTGIRTAITAENVEATYQALLLRVVAFSGMVEDAHAGDDFRRQTGLKIGMLCRVVGGLYDFRAPSTEFADQVELWLHEQPVTY